MYAGKDYCRQGGREGGRAGGRERGCVGWRAGKEAKGMEQELTVEGYTDTVCGHRLLLQMNTASLEILTSNTVVCWFTRALASISTRTTST